MEKFYWDKFFVLALSSCNKPLEYDIYLRAIKVRIGDPIRGRTTLWLFDPELEKKREREKGKEKDGAFLFSQVESRG